MGMPERDGGLNQMRLSEALWCVGRLVGQRLRGRRIEIAMEIRQARGLPRGRFEAGRGCLGMYVMGRMLDRQTSGTLRV